MSGIAPSLRANITPRHEGPSVTVPPHDHAHDHEHQDVPSDLSLRVKALESLLVGVPRTDPLSFGASVAVLAIVAVVAHLVPALRALHVDPAIALRAD